MNTLGLQGYNPSSLRPDITLSRSSRLCLVIAKVAGDDIVKVVSSQISNIELSSDSQSVVVVVTVDVPVEDASVAARHLERGDCIRPAVAQVVASLRCQVLVCIVK